MKKIIYYPNPNIESRRIMQVVDVHKESTKSECSTLVMKLFGDFLGALKTCASIVISKSGFGYYVITALLMTNIAMAQKTPKAVSKKEHKEVVEAIGSQLNDNYVFPDVAIKMSQYISEQLKKGHYKDISNPTQFATVLTIDLRFISHDKHIRVQFDPERIAEQNRAISAEDQEKLKQQHISRAKKRNFGFVELKILDGNIGYLDLRGFEDTSYASETAVAAMNYLSNTDAIIFDLRKNGGGSPNMIQLITSYLYESEPVHLNNFYWRPTNLNTQTWTLPYVPGKRSPDTPVYVLTSERTFSAAEEFSYNLKNLKRATLIGETTGGGAHPGGPVNATDRFIVGVPSGRAINPITKTNWEGVGVIPHIKVDAKDALTTAHIKALETLIEKSENEELKNQYQWSIELIEVKNTNIILDKDKLKSYVGTYGPRVITLEGNKLFYQRVDRTKYQLLPMGENKFFIKDLNSFRVKFEMKKNKAIAIIGLYDNGESDKNLKD